MASGAGLKRLHFGGPARSTCAWMPSFDILAAMTLGQGFSVEFDGLYLKVEAMAEGWHYSITPVKGGAPLQRWTSGPAPGTEQYQEPEGTKFVALTTAMGILQRKDDPHTVFASLIWRAYGPGH